MCIRKMAGRIKTALAAFTLTVSAALFSACSHNGDSSVSFYHYQSSFFANYTMKEEDGKYLFQGTVCQAEDDTNAVLQRVCAEEEAVLTVAGVLADAQGDIRLVYTGSGGEEILLTDETDKWFEKTLSLPAGDGYINFAGYGKSAVCDFDLQVAWGDGVSVEADSYDMEEGIIEPDAAVPEIEEGIPGLEDIDIPVVDNWPESISCVSEGMYAKLLVFDIAIEEPVTLTISCVTNDGTLSMRIEDAGGRLYFDEKDMLTGEYKAAVDKAGTYTVFLEAEYYYGNFTICPE